MTTIDNYISDFNLIELGINLKKIESGNSKQERTKLILAISEYIAIPVIVVKNINRLFKVKAAKRELNTYITKFMSVFPKATEEQKIELYAVFNTLTEMINDENGKSLKKTGYITKLLLKEHLSIKNKINEYDNIFYKLAYPDNKNENDPEFVREILEAHSNAGIC